MQQASTTYHSPFLEDVISPDELIRESNGLLTKSSLSYILRNREFNGLSEAGGVLKVNRKLHIRREKFKEWFLSNHA